MELIVESLKGWKKLFFPLLPLTLLYALLVVLPNFAHHYLGRVAATKEYATLLVIVTLFELWFLMALLHQGFAVLNQESCSIWSSLLTASKKYIIALIATMLFVIMLFAGYLLLVLPGIFLHVLFSLYLLFILKENQGIISSLKMSARVVLPAWWRMFFALLLPVVLFGVIATALEKIIQLPLVLHRQVPLHQVSWANYLILIALITCFFPWFIATLVTCFQLLKNRG